ncbi:hypothetical protein HHJ49_00020 [Escherichia coli]|nr:hypothetical protein HHJ49_00020 [Escherichia coli]
MPEVMRHVNTVEIASAAAESTVNTQSERKKPLPPRRFIFKHDESVRYGFNDPAQKRRL